MLPERLHVSDLQAEFLHGSDDPTDFMKLAIGEHVSGYEGSFGQWTGAGRSRDGMVEEASTGDQHFSDTGEVVLEPRRPHMLEHADAGHCVIGPVADIAVILISDLDEVGETGFGDTFPS